MNSVERMAARSLTKEEICGLVKDSQGETCPKNEEDDEVKVKVKKKEEKMQSVRLQRRW